MIDTRQLAPPAAIVPPPVPRAADESVGENRKAHLPHADPALLAFDHVSKWYGPVIGVNQVTLTMGEGITGLVGSNGAGKSTLLRLATGQLRADIGQVAVVGRDAWDWRAKALIGYCPDTDAFYEEMSGAAFVE